MCKGGPHVLLGLTGHLRWQARPPLLPASAASSSSSSQATETRKPAQPVTSPHSWDLLPPAPPSTLSTNLPFPLDPSCVAFAPEK